jgi:tRNA threonylcarbamoyladenosine biosynthesis protein TsaB
MKILALDTVGWHCSVALWEDARELAFREIGSERDQAALLPQLVKDLMRDERIDQIIVNVGPGSFTGIRVGLAFAKGLAMGWGLPLKGIDAFTAAYLSLDAQEDVLILIEARRQDVFARRYLKGLAQEDQSLTREDIKKILISPHPPLLSGSGVYPFLEGVDFQECVPTWKGAQAIAHAFFRDPEVVLDPLPFYVREADVNFIGQPCRSTL